MPVEHRYFLEEIEKKSPVSNWLADDKVVTAYNNCIEKTTAFRQAHLEMVAKYIVGQKAKVGPGQTGTGGTNPMIFLKSLKKDTSDKRR